MRDQQHIETVVLPETLRKHAREERARGKENGRGLTGVRGNGIARRSETSARKRK